MANIKKIIKKILLGDKSGTNDKEVEERQQQFEQEVREHFKDSDFTVGLISINAHTKVLNFASPIHTYAFQQFLGEYGIKSKIINYYPCYYANYDPRHPYEYYKAKKEKGSNIEDLVLERWKRLYKEREMRYDKFQKFIDENYDMTQESYNYKLLDEKDPGFDAYCCVTDVIWKYNKNYGFDRGFFLASKCMADKPKIAYAASIGANKIYTEEQGEEFKSLIEPIDYISVREKVLQNYINNNTDKTADLVLDPVFLKEKEFYEKIMIRPNESKKYVLIYVVMGTADNAIETGVEYAKQHNLEVIELSEYYEHEEIGGITHKTVYNIGIEEWLGYMYDAEMIFTNSFHCCAFSIIFEKQFYAGWRGGQKISHLLKTFKLSNRLVSDIEQCNQEDIDYEPVQKIMKKKINHSKNYILKALDETREKLNL